MADREESRLPLTAILGLAFALATLWWVQEPLKSSRPEGDRRHLGRIEQVQARLWQDPLEAARAHHQTHRDRHAAGQPDAHTIGFEGRANQRVDVFLVVTEGGPYVENHEKRLRDRYAVISALGVACFVPEDSERIQYFLRDEKDVVPFEWFRSRQTPKCHRSIDGEQRDNILVVWLTDGWLTEPRAASDAGDESSSSPVSRLKEATKHLELQYRKITCVGASNRQCDRHLAFKVIGPAGSTTLRAMLESAASSDEQSSQEKNPGSRSGSIALELYSPWATAAPELLVSGLSVDDASLQCTDANSCAGSLVTLLARDRVTLAHAVPSDKELAVALVAELQRRQVEIGRHPIALIGEWDTFYGRALPMAFKAAACVGMKTDQRPDALKKACSSVSSAIQHQVEHPDEWRLFWTKIHRYSYLRGLDGLTPEDDQEPKKAETQRDRGLNLTQLASGAAEVEALERAEGQSQLDYTRRLVDKMKQDAEERAGEGGKPLRAIGILGSDVHDKLLILKAVRQAFPNVLFFTTDLDARLLDPSEYKWTRNVIIASPFGLELHDSIQRDIPPFRDSYQTSAFLSVLRAVHQIRPEEASSAKAGCKEVEFGATTMPVLTEGPGQSGLERRDDLFATPICPRIFEVGRYGAVDLSGTAGPDTLQSVHPARELMPYELRGLRIKILKGALAVALIALFFTRFLGHAWKWLWLDFIRGRVPRSLAFGAACFLVASGSSLIFWGVLEVLRKHATQDGWQGEPFSLTDGVSTWPSVAIRMAVVIWCVGCVLKAWLDLRWNHQSLCRDYGLTPGGRYNGAGRKIRRFLNSIGWVMAVPRKQDTSVEANLLMGQYQQAGSLGNRLGRALLLGIVYLGFLMLILTALGPAESPWRPCRGEHNCAIEEWVTYLAVISMVFLNMFVFDIVLLCQSFIARLKAAPIVWPEEVLARYRTQRKMETLHLRRVLAMHVIADRTQAVHTFVFCPFVALFFMVVSRNRYFDNYDFPPWLIIVWTVYAIVAIGSVIKLRSTANSARELALSELREELVGVAGTEGRGPSNAEQLRLTIQEIKAIRNGAFAPLLRHPAVSTSLLAILAFLQYWLIGG